MLENHYFLTNTGLGSRKETIHYLTICELVGVYLFEKLSSLIGRENVGLAAINSGGRPVLDKMRNKIIALFKNEG